MNVEPVRICLTLRNRIVTNNGFDNEAMLTHRIKFWQ